MPCVDTLKCTTVAKGRGLSDIIMPVALATACGPVRDSVSTEFRYSTLHAEGRGTRSRRTSETFNTKKKNGGKMHEQEERKKIDKRKGKGWHKSGV